MQIRSGAPPSPVAWPHATLHGAWHEAPTQVSREDLIAESNKLVDLNPLPVNPAPRPIGASA